MFHHVLLIHIQVNFQKLVFHAILYVHNVEISLIFAQHVFQLYQIPSMLITHYVILSVHKKLIMLEIIAMHVIFQEAFAIIALKGRQIVHHAREENIFKILILGLVLMFAYLHISEKML